MRTLVPFVPAIICAGTMIVCVRMMRSHDQQMRDERADDMRDDHQPT